MLCVSVSVSASYFHLTDVMFCCCCFFSRLCLGLSWSNPLRRNGIASSAWIAWQRRYSVWKLERIVHISQWSVSKRLGKLYFDHGTGCIMLRSTGKLSYFRHVFFSIFNMELFFFARREATLCSMEFYLIKILILFLFSCCICAARYILSALFVLLPKYTAIGTAAWNSRWYTSISARMPKTSRT